MPDNSNPDGIRSGMHSNCCTDLINADFFNSKPFPDQVLQHLPEADRLFIVCLLYTSDAADD